MKMEEIRSLSVDQIKDRLLDLRKEQLNLRFQQATSQLEKPHRAGEVRKTIARLKTELGARQRTAAGE